MTCFPPSAVRAALARQRGIGACLVLLALGCDDATGEGPAKSRVQAVLAEPGSAGSAAGVSIKPSAEPAPSAKPRAPFCQAEMASKPQPFNPKAVPVQVALDGQPELASDPLEKARGRWTWVNFWAAWCVPCKAELPLLFSWQDTLAARLQFRFVSLDDDERQLREFLAQQPAGGLKSSYWLPDGATRQAWLEALSLKAEPELPLQLLLDPKGMVRCRVEGAVEPEDLAALQRIVSG